MTDLNHLEARVEADRAALASSFDTLSDTLSPDSIAGDVGARLRGYSTEVGAQAIAAAKENPAALALFGAGLALMMAGKGRRAEDAGIAHDPDVAMAGFDARVAKADASIRAQATGLERSPEAWRLRAAMDRGLSVLPEPARARVLKARTAALEAQEKVEARAKAAARHVKRTHNDQPMIAGALAFGLGAIAAALLPGTRREDALLGAKRDALMAEARRAMTEELAVLRGAANRAMDDIADRTAAQ